MPTGSPCATTTTTTATSSPPPTASAPPSAPTCTPPAWRCASTQPDGGRHDSTATTPAACSPCAPRRRRVPARVVAGRPARRLRRSRRGPAPRSSTAPTARSSASSTPSAATVELTHDHLERLVGLAAPGGAKWELGYSGVGLLSLVHDPAGGAWSYDHDAEGRLRHGHRPARATRSADATTPPGGWSRWWTRPATRPATPATPSAGSSATEAPEGATTTYAWDEWGRATEVRAARRRHAHTSTRRPDGCGRSRPPRAAAGPTPTTPPAGSWPSPTPPAPPRRTRWDVCDRLVADHSPAGRTDRWAYDVDGRVVQSTAGGRTAGVTATTAPVGSRR